MTVQDLTVVAGVNALLPAKPLAARDVIDGLWRDSDDGATFDRVCPAHGVLVTRAAKGGAAETEAAIAAARTAFDAGSWSELTGKDRATLLLRVADLIDRNRERIAWVETLVTGRFRADVDVRPHQVFPFAINMEKAVAFDPNTEMQIS